MITSTQESRFQLCRGSDGTSKRSEGKMCLLNVHHCSVTPAASEKGLQLKWRQVVPWEVNESLLNNYCAPRNRSGAAL